MNQKVELNKYYYFQLLNTDLDNSIFKRIMQANFIATAGYLA